MKVNLDVVVMNIVEIILVCAKEIEVKGQYHLFPYLMSVVEMEAEMVNLNMIRMVFVFVIAIVAELELVKEMIAIDLVPELRLNYFGENS